jgi:SagB-type dehydrogenase family enzyme
MFLIALLLIIGGKMEEINLPKPKLKGKVSVEECIFRRRSVREFTSKPLTLTQISQLLWSLQGITDKRGFRTTPSAGATYPLVIRVVTEEGVFLYIPHSHKLIKELDKNLLPQLAKACLGQVWVKEAGCNFVISAVYERTTRTYGKRGELYVHIEVGHAAQNLHLQAVALGLGSVPIGAFREREVKKLLNLPQKEVVLYIIPVGYKK